MKHEIHVNGIVVTTTIELDPYAANKSTTGTVGFLYPGEDGNLVWHFGRLTIIKHNPATRNVLLGIEEYERGTVLNRLPLFKWFTLSKILNFTDEVEVQ